MLLPIYISIVPLKFGVDIQSQIKVRLLPIYISAVPLKFGVDIQSQTKVRVLKPKNLIWLPDGHFEIKVTEN